MKMSSYVRTLAAVAFLLTVGSVNAAPIAITNPEFDPDAGGWSPTSGASGGFEVTLNAPGSTGGSYDIAAGSITQTLTATVAANTNYELSASFYNYNDLAQTVTLNLLAGTTVIASAPITVGGVAGNPLHTWATYTASVAANDIPAVLLGQNLGIDFYASSAWANVDHFSLTATTVPEPGTVVLLMTGLIGLLAYAWRRRK